MGRAKADAQTEELRDWILRLSRLVEISVTLNSTLDLEELLRFIIRSAADLVESEAASLLLIDEMTNDLCLAAATDVDPKDLGAAPVLKEGSIAGTIFREDRPLILNEVRSSPDEPVIDPALNFEVHSLIGVPLRIRDQVTGVLEAVNKRHGSFDEGDLQTLSNIASLAAVAIHNARLVDALRKAYDELGKLDKLKSDFIAIASHELRTPLGLILGNAALLEDAGQEAKADYVEAILSAAMRMRGLVEDMTNMNMLQVGSAELNLAVHELQPILQSAYDTSVERARARGQTLSIDLPPEPMKAMVDVPKITLALTNLLNNAMRFTPEAGSIAFLLEAHGREAWLRVRDNGIGIPADQVEAIFDQFYQVEDHLTRRHAGLGLGLAIVRAIVLAHGGRVWVESEGEARGATFTVALPLVE